MNQPQNLPTADFALCLLANEIAAHPGENVMLSPLSVSLALGMTANGARGTTLSGINKALGLGDDIAANNLGYAGLLEALKRTGSGVTLNIANAIFARLGVGFKPEFLASSEEFFSAKVDELDFNDPATVKLINGFVDEATNHKISRVLGDTISSEIVMYLINCVYFKGEWSEKFDKALTENQPFLAPQGSIDLATMYRFGDMVHVVDRAHSAWEAITLPFGTSEEMRFVVVLPGAGKSVDELLPVFDAAALLRVASTNWKSEGHLWLPRIDVEYDSLLNQSLQQMGMEQAFADADFSGMRPIPPVLFISEVKHKTVFAVNEEGAEGAAVTSVGMGLESFSQPFNMRVDRPFLAFVVDSKTEAVIFAGLINKPA